MLSRSGTAKFWPRAPRDISDPEPGACKSPGVQPPEIPSLPSLDRASPLRKDSDALEARLDDGRTLLVPVWRNKSLVRDGELLAPAVVPISRAPHLLESAFELVFLGLVGDAACFAVDVSSIDDPASDPVLGPAGRFEDLRIAGSVLHPSDFELLAFARQILHFARQQRFCSRCGGPTRVREGGHVRECGGCETKFYPRTDPAVMVLVTDGDRCLLARQPGFPAGMYSALAGCVEPGESVEGCVERETFEEVGLRVAEPRYFRSQSSPFPQSLMLGYFARALSTEITLDRDELEAARWFSREELARPDGFFYPPRVSLAHHMIRAFIDGER